MQNSLDSGNSVKRDALFLSLSGVFLTALMLGNVIGTTKFVTLFSVELTEWFKSAVPELVRDGNLYSLSVPAGVLAYPFTFLATDLISELFGRKKVQLMVLVGLGMNAFMFGLMTVNHLLPNTYGVSGGLNVFEEVYEFMVGNTIASMIAYLIAQSVDVQLFHFWKRLTRGKYLWLRNTASTSVSQLVDSTAIITILYLAGKLSENVTTIGDIMMLILNSYLFKFIFALIDTPLFYLGVHLFQNYDEDPAGYRLNDSSLNSS